MNRKLLLIFSVFLCLPVLGLGQSASEEAFSIPLSNPGAPGKLVLQQIAGSIRVTGYDGNEVLVSVTYSGKKSKQEVTRDGMKRIGGATMQIGAEEKDNVVRVVSKNWSGQTDFNIRVPRRFSLKLKTVNNGVIEVDGTDGAFELSNTNGNITLTTVSGSVSADSVNGDIIASFSRVDADAPMAFSSLNGDLEVRFPASLKADVKARSDQGDIFTDFEMELNPSEPARSTKREGGVYRVQLDDWVRGQINGGGPELLFKTYNGDISIRKG